MEDLTYMQIQLEIIFGNSIASDIIGNFTRHEFNVFAKDLVTLAQMSGDNEFYDLVDDFFTEIQEDVNEGFEPEFAHRPDDLTTLENSVEKFIEMCAVPHDLIHDRIAELRPLN